MKLFGPDTQNQTQTIDTDLLDLAHKYFGGRIFADVTKLTSDHLELWGKMWPNFQPQEMACHGDGLLMIDVDALCRLQALRTLLGIPMHLNSAYRSPPYNLKIGGAKGSFHMKARAYDCRTFNQRRHDYVDAAKSVGFGGIGYYPSFIHIDTGPVRSW